MIKLNESDLSFDQVCAGHANQYVVVLTHRPTGISVRKKGQNVQVIKMQLMEELKRELESREPMFEKGR